MRWQRQSYVFGLQTILFAVKRVKTLRFDDLAITRGVNVFANRDFKIRGRGGFWNVVTEESLGRERRCKRGKNEVKSCNATKNNTT